MALKESRRNSTILCGCCLAVFALLMCAIFIPVTYQPVSYDKIALKKAKIGGAVDRSKVYAVGRHRIGINGEFVTYPATIQTLFLPDLNVWTSSKASTTGDDENAAAGTLLDMDISFQYRLDPDRLGDLYEKVGTEFSDLVRNLAITAVKNTATLFTADEYLENRRDVEHAIGVALRKVMHQQADTLVSGFQLREVKFPREFYDRKLAGAVALIRSEKLEKFKQEAQIVRSETDRLVTEIENTNRVILEVAKNQALNEVAEGNNKARKIRNTAKAQALFEVVSGLKIKGDKQKLSLDYILGTLLQAKKPEILVNFATPANVNDVG